MNHNWREYLKWLGVKSVGVYSAKKGMTVAIHAETEAMYELARQYLQSRNILVL